jgi:hypothetical protein
MFHQRGSWWIWARWPESSAHAAAAPSMGAAGPQERERAPRDAIDGGDRRDTLPRGNPRPPPVLPFPALRNKEASH